MHNNPKTIVTMKQSKMWMLAAILICGTTMVLNSCGNKDNSAPAESKDAGAPDYSKKTCWYQIPEITKQIGRAHV